MSRRRHSEFGRVALAVAICTGGANLSLAQDEAVGMEPMVVSANRYPAPAAEVGSTVRVLDAGQIARLNKTTVIELLRTMPGVEVSQGGGSGRNASLFIRGANSDHTLVLIDGVRANPVAGGQYDFANLSAENIESIEVVSGPQSTLYGSEAMGGVVSIVTRKGGAGAPSSLSVEGGSFGYYKGAAAARGGDASKDYSLSASYEAADGVSVASKSLGNQEKDAYQNLSTVNRIGTALGDDGRADLFFRYTQAETDLDGFTYGIGPTDALNYTQDTESIVSSLHLRKPVTDWLIPSLRIGLAEENLDGKDPDTTYNNYEIRSRLADLETLVDVIACEASVLTAGYAFEQRNGRNVGQFDETIDVNSVFLQDRASIGEGVHGTAGVRYDDYSDFGDEVTYRGTLSAQVPKTGERLHGSYGTGFNAPNLNNLYFPNFGNPDLDPETSQGFDVGIESTVGPAVLDLTYFRTDFDDLITYDATRFTAANIAKANVEGVEATLALAVTDDLSVKAGYVYTDSEDEIAGAPLARRPKHRTTLTVGYRMLEKLTGSVNLVAVKDRIESDGTSMDNYARVDTAMEYQVTDNVFPYARIENLFDQDYEEQNGFTSPGFAGVVGVRALL